MYAADRPGDRSGQSIRDHDADHGGFRLDFWRRKLDHDLVAFVDLVICRHAVFQRIRAVLSDPHQQGHMALGAGDIHTFGNGFVYRLYPGCDDDHQRAYILPG